MKLTEAGEVLCLALGNWFGRVTDLAWLPSQGPKPFDPGSRPPFCYLLRHAKNNERAALRRRLPMWRRGGADTRTV
jgi:hypothetical protein